jgi:hypothetical protein
MTNNYNLSPPWVSAVKGNLRALASDRPPNLTALFDLIIFHRLLVVVKKTVHYLNDFFYNHLCRNP